MKTTKSIYGALPLAILCFVKLFITGSVWAQMLTPITNSEWVNQKDACFGGGWIDYNGDNKPDPYFTHIAASSFLYENKGNGDFEQISNRLPAIDQSYLSGISWGDCDNDGLNDLFVCSMGSKNHLLKNMGEGRFEALKSNQVMKDNGFFIQGSFVDYDNDGWLDIFAPTVTNLNFVLSNGVVNYLYHNDGSGNFEKAFKSGLMEDYTNTTCTAFSDYDNDGDQDVFLTEFFRDNLFYENNGDGTFTKITNSIITANNLMSLSCSWADYDNDGFMDLLVLNGDVKAGKISNYLFRNNGDKTFTRVTTSAIAEYTGCSWSSAWGDLDNDGDIDLYLGTIFEDDIIFLNNGDGTFENYTNFERKLNSTGVSIADFNNDGFLDVTVMRPELESHLLFQNNGNSNHWISLALEGTSSNYSGIGAKIKLKASLSGKTSWQYRELNGNQGLRGFNELRAHFGLGDASIIDSLIVVWPSKSESILTNVTVNQQITIKEEMPEGFIRASFVADKLIGRGSLSVQFTDKSYTDPKHPITSWSWDFNDDGQIDATDPSPVYTFSNDTGEVFSISLTISNDIYTKTFTKKDFITIYPLYSNNLATWNKASASSSENSNYPAINAIDNNMDTRWSSDFSDQQWFKVELDSLYPLGKIRIHWEGAYASKYDIETSVDGEKWKTIFTDSNGNGGIDNIQFSPDTARFVRVNMLERATQYGYSFFELEIYRPDSTISNSNFDDRTGHNSLILFPNPVRNNNLNITVSLPQESDLSINIYNLNGMLVGEVANGKYPSGITNFIYKNYGLNGRLLSEGVYFCQLLVSKNGQQEIEKSKFLILR